MPPQDTDYSKALLYRLWDSLSIEGHETDSFGEYDNGLVLGTGSANSIRELIDALRQTSQDSRLAVLASEHLIDELSEKKFDSLDLIKYPEDGLLKWTSNPSWWQEVFEKKFDSVFFHINQKSLLAVENILEILLFAETDSTIRFIDHDERIYLLSPGECSAALNSISKIDEWTERKFPPSHTTTQSMERPCLLFDCRVFGEKAQTGINRYANELLKTMPSLLEGTDIRAIGCREASVPDGVTKIPLSLPLNDHRRAGNLLGLSSFLEGSDVIFSPYYPIPEKRNAGGVLTIHDLIPLVHPEWFANPATIEFFRTTLRESARAADKVIADSHSTKKDVIHYYEIEESKVEVVPLAPNSIFTQTPDSEKTQASSDLTNGRPYFLSVSTLEPRKNLVRTIKAYELYMEREKSIKPALLLVGKKGWKNRALNEAYERSKYKESIFITGFLDDDSLVEAYRGAIAFLYPSLYEGFGLPVLVAMACGTPVITSNTSSLSEIAKDCALCCNPKSVDEIAHLMSEISSDPSRRKELIALGLRNSATYTWEKTAKETIHVISSCLSD
jgi:glycosyltransferase involved in cell wall biosynthesis